MKNYGRLFRFGFISWLPIFLSSMALSPLKTAHRPLFETLMGIVLTAWTVALTIHYFADVRRSYLPEGLHLGLSFFLVNVALDLLCLMWEPLKTPFLDYATDVGLAYLSMPIITMGFAYALRRLRRSSRKREGNSDGSSEQQSQTSNVDYSRTRQRTGVLSAGSR